MLQSLLLRRANDNEAGQALPLFGLMVFVTG